MTELASSSSSPDSDGEGIGSSDTPHSSQSSMSSSGTCCDRCSSFSQLSFDSAAIRSNPPLGPRDFNLLRRIGSGDIGNVYLCRLRDQTPGDHSFTYAMKIVDKQSLAKKNKLGRADTERRILRLLHHPFLPTLFADFDASPQFSCIVMEFCAGGNLHSLLHRQPSRRFSLPAARFYAAEVLLALEYLHMLGIVYRDLKPENILIRSDGHIMLTDFDLSLQSFAAPAIEFVDNAASSSSAGGDRNLFCLPNRLFRPKKAKAALNRRFVAEPVDARSNSFVGTHEYVSPEVAGGGAHGNAVDWWAYGVFLYELVYGRTPFAGPTNDATLRNILKQPLGFPSVAGEDLTAVNDLISRLLIRDPAARLGSRRGAADVKMHRFFRGLNFALLRSCKPPLVPAAGGPGLARLGSDKGLRKSARFDFF